MSLLIPDGDFKAYLFDCDGTIADTMPLHHEAWNIALARWNCSFDEALFYSWAGIPIPKIVQMLNERHGLEMPVHEVIEIKEKLFLEHLSRVQAIPSVVEQIELKSGVIPLAVVSGSPRDSVLRTLNTLELIEHFQTIVGGDDCGRGKPAPDPFLLAAQRLGVDPKHCLVFEDADLGIEAAKAAGMAWVKVPGAGSR